MRATTSAPRFVDFLTKPVTPKQLADSVLHALHGEQGAPANPAAAPGGAHQRLRGVRLLVVEDNANRQVAAEPVDSEGARWPRRRRAGGRSAGAGGERAVRYRC